MAWLPFRDNCDLVLKLKSLKNTDLHQLFFKLLGQIYLEEHVLISKCKECYDQAKKRFQDEPDLSEARSQQIVDQEISKAQKALSGIENAALRSRRRDMDRLGTDEHDQRQNQRLGDVSVKLKYLFDENKAKVDSDKLHNFIEWLSTCPFRVHHNSVSSRLMPESGTWLSNHSVYQNWLQSSSSSIIRTNLVRLGSRGCVELILELTMRRRAYIALDAIDELRQEARSELIESLHRIVNESDGLAKVLVTSRNDAQIEGLLQSATTIEVSPAENQCDIEKFVASQLRTIVRGRRLLNGSASETLLEKMRVSLINGAREMFLWIQLQIDCLCRKKTEHDIITALDAGLAENLDKIYAETYKSFLELDRTAKSVVKGVFSWILYAKSPLTINALRCALVLGPDLASQPEAVTLPDLVDVCYNLVVLDSTMNTLRLCHPSARDYMRQQHMFSEVSGNQLLAASCLGKCSQGLADPPEWLSSPYAIDNFSLDGEDYEDALQKTAEAGFRDAVEYLMKPDVARKFGRDTGKEELRQLYADMWKCLFFFTILGDTRAVRKLLEMGADATAAAYNGHEEAVKLLIEEGADIYRESNKFKDALHAAVQGGHLEIASFLQEKYPPPPGRSLPAITRGDRQDTDDEADGESVESKGLSQMELTDEEPIKYGLVFAATIGNIATIRQELQASAVAEDDITQALVAAAEKGNHQATKVLLEDGTIDFPGQVQYCTDDDEDEAAVRGRNIHTLNRLLEMTEQGTYDRSELIPSFMEACREGFDAGVLQLLNRNKGVLQANEISHGMAAASASGHKRIVLKLLHNLKCERRGTAFINYVVQNALLSAAGVGESDVIQHMLDDTDIRDHKDFDAIITRALVTAYVVPSLRDEDSLFGHRLPHPPQHLYSYPRRQAPFLPRSRPPLHASFNDFASGDDSDDSSESDTQETDALRASIEAFARIRYGEALTGFDTQYPEERAKEERQMEIVSLILDHVTDLSDRNGEQATHPLRIAAQWGNSQVVQVLLKHGAADGFSPEQLTALILLAAGRKTGISHLIVLELLNFDRETCLPTTKDGSLDPAVLGTIGNAIRLLHDPARAQGYQILSKRGLFTSQKAARDLMKDGMRQLIQIIFRKLPHQTAGGGVFGDLLHVAAVAGDLSTVRQLIKHGVDVNHAMFFSHSPLGAAAEFGQVQVMKALTRAKARVHSDERRQMGQIYGAQEPAIKAILGGHVSALKLLLDEGADPNLYAGDESLLLLAAQSKTPAMLKYLLQAVADPKADPLALVTAAHDGELDMVSSLLDAGADANSLAIHGTSYREQHLSSPLYIACEQGRTEIVHVLLERGADANLEVGDHDGLSLVVAARQGHVDIVEALLQHGCNPTAWSEGFGAISSIDQRKFGSALRERDFQLNGGSSQTRGYVAVPRDGPAPESKSIDSELEGEVCLNAIESACVGQKGVTASLKILKVLLKWVDDPDKREEVCLEAMRQVSDAQNKRMFEALLEYVPLDSVALDLASRCGSVKSVQTILSRGISINAASPGGKVPLQVAVDYGHWDLTQFLVTNGANLETRLDEDSPLNLYRLVASIIESYAFSTLAKHKSITKYLSFLLVMLEVSR
ncbi:uncharacterized protein J7T54_005181 [Emericellopsis cladophorae]|uniref:GPI inositol-deacylase winged helix domain-containing protein n=1 Tax=Emericellopsis cladophorae TaxID=2686198 RepID=A0A9Q0BEU3_9HYPO|nr:uncharacterized protein J7T54_005181 [Emericellopsis cladophorae]KAI6781970.1 hypothetical protein J7T54_005181 [Emericellopsis cladophorae]